MHHYSFGRRNFWTKQLLDKTTFGQSKFWTKQLLDKVTFGRSNFWTKPLLDKATFGWINFWMKQLLELAINLIQLKENWKKLLNISFRGKRWIRVWPDSVQLVHSFLGVDNLCIGVLEAKYWNIWYGFCWQPWYLKGPYHYAKTFDMS